MTMRRVGIGGKQLDLVSMAAKILVARSLILLFRTTIACTAEEGHRLQRETPQGLQRLRQVISS